MDTLDDLLYLDEYTTILRRRWPEVLAVALIVVIAVVSLNLRQPRIFMAETVLQVELPGLEPLEEPPAEELEALMTSTVVTDRLGDELAADLEAGDAQVLASSVAGSAVFEIEVVDGDPDRAARIADGYASAFLEVHAQDLADDGFADQSPGEIISPAVVPESPISPRPLVEAVLRGVLLGAVLGLAVAVVHGLLDRTIRTDRAARRVVGGPDVPVLGRLPNHAGQRPVLASDPASWPAECHRGVATNLRHLLSVRLTADDRGPERQAWEVVVASAEDADGRTTVAVNLALAFAQSGLDVILVDADLRRPGVADLLGLAPLTGLGNLLEGRSAVADTLVAVPDTPHLRVLSGGTGTTGSPASLVASRRMQAVADELRAAADLVVYDIPPLASVSDGLELLARVDAGVWVIRIDHSHRDAIEPAIARLADLGITPLGVVINGHRPDVLRKQFHQVPYPATTS